MENSQKSTPSRLPLFEEFIAEKNVNDSSAPISEDKVVEENENSGVGTSETVTE
jgi:hypothetical protein